METKVIEIAASQGVWAVLSISLIFYILKAQEKRDVRQEEREKNYQIIITKLNDKLVLLDEIKKDVLEIKEKLHQ